MPPQMPDPMSAAMTVRASSRTLARASCPTRARRAVFFLLLLALPVIAAACNLGGDGGSAELALSVDQSQPDKPILALAPETVQVGQQYFIRLEVPRPLDAPFVRIRIEKRVGVAFQQRGEYDHPLTPPWNIAVIPVTVTSAGEWNLAVIANSRKITDVTFHAERP